MDGDIKTVADVVKAITEGKVDLNEMTLGVVKTLFGAVGIKADHIKTAPIIGASENGGGICMTTAHIPLGLIGAMGLLEAARVLVRANFEDNATANAAAETPLPDEPSLPGVE